uniref:Uncharacterized protein n=1 Tax=Plectus sambesii TaxID=2011161 RepID=A0A914WK04_9BILA
MKECFGRSPGLQSSKSNADSSRSSECTSLSASDVLSSATFKVPSVHDNSRIEVQNEPEISIVKAVDCHPSVVSRLLPPVWGGVRVKEEDDLPLFLDRNRPMNLSSIAPSSVCSRAQSSSTYTEYSEMDAFASSNRACSVTPEPAYMHSVKPELECDSQSLSPALLPTPELQRHLNIHAPTQDNAGKLIFG